MSIEHHSAKNWYLYQYRGLMLAVLLLSLTLHLVTLRELETKSPFFYAAPPGVDQHSYVRDAYKFTLGHWPAQTPFRLSPFYSFYLGLIYKFLGQNLVLPRVFQIFEGVLVCALLYKLGQLIFNLNIAIVAATLLATYGPFIFYNIELTTVPHSTLWICLSLFMAFLYSKRTKIIYLLTIGVALGVGSLGQPNIFIVLVGIGLWFSLLEKPIKAKAVAILVIIGIAGLITAIPTWHNFRATRQLKFVTTTGDYNLYIGNNSEATGVYKSVPSEIVSKIDKGETSYLLEVWHFVQSQPLTWLALMGQKLILYIAGSDMELGSNVNYYFWGVRHSNLLSVLPLRYELISLMGLISLRFLWQRRASLLYLSFGIYALGVTFFFVQTRFRMPFAPILILLASALAFDFYQRYKRGDKAVLLLILTILAALAVLLVRYRFLLDEALTIVS